MEENKNQNASTSTTPMPNLPGGIMVKDLDGRYKIAYEGELRELDSILSNSEVASPATNTSLPPGHAAGQELGFPKFTDITSVPADEHFKEPYRKSEPHAKAELHFHPDDQKELEREIEKINTLFSLAPQKKYSVTKIAEKLAEKHQLRLSDADTRTFTKALISFFRQARNSIQTRSVLVGPKTAGGLAIQSATADHVIAVAKHLKRSIEDGDGVVVEEDIVSEQPKIASVPVMPTAVPAHPAEMAASRPQQKPQPPKQEPPKPAPPVSPRPEPVVKKTEPAQQQKIQTSEPPEKPTQTRPPFFVDDSTAGQRTAPVVPQPSVAPAPAPMPQPLRPVTEIPKMMRPQMPLSPTAIADVKRTDQQSRAGVLTGRVEELAMMDLTTWRMLDSDPRIRAGKILGKIQNLEHESLTRKSQGIDAWRGNEVYRHYLYLGQRSLEQKKNVAEVISEMSAQNKPTLSLEEFEAISDLNRMLRY